MANRARCTLLKVLVPLAVFCFFPLLGALAQAAESVELERILFIGNSFTFRDDLPTQLAAIWNEMGVSPKVETFRITYPGADLDFHVKYGKALETIRQGGWRIVVLQPRDYEALSNYRDFASAAAILSQEAQSTHAEVLYFETWGLREGRGESDKIYAQEWSGGDFLSMQARLRAAFRQIASETGGRVVPVGDAWEMSVKKHPEIDLYDSDGLHASRSGYYLRSCVFFAFLTGKDPRTSKWLPYGVTEEEAVILRAIAQQTVAEK